LLLQIVAKHSNHWMRTNIRFIFSFLCLLISQDDSVIVASGLRWISSIFRKYLHTTTTATIQTPTSTIIQTPTSASTRTSFLLPAWPRIHSSYKPLETMTSEFAIEIEDITLTGCLFLRVFIFLSLEDHGEEFYPFYELDNLSSLPLNSCNFWVMELSVNFG